MTGYVSPGRESSAVAHGRTQARTCPQKWNKRHQRSSSVGNLLGMRFLRLEDVAEELNVKLPQVRALVKSGELPAIQIGGRGMWRVERVELENYIQRRYAEAREEIAREPK